MWVMVDDNFPEHWKLFAAGRHLGKNGSGRAVAVWLEGICYANRNLTDGFLPEQMVKLMKHDARPLAVAAVLAREDVRLWDVAEGGWRIHDYHDRNPTAQQVKVKQEWDRRRKQLYAIPGLVQEIRQRDKDCCRYCGTLVSWTDRRGPKGGTYDHVVPRGPNTLENVVVACAHCNTSKGDRTPEQWGRPLLPPPGARS
jgi:5-methylcytosine-specific restriction endonuclease McrA